MTDYNSWKQPTPTDIRYNENIDLLSRLLFFDILNGCQNNDYHKSFYHGNQRFDINLKRGQYVFNVSKYQRGLSVPRKRIEKSLEIISNWYSPLTITRKTYGLIITVLNYDELTKMTNTMTNTMKTQEKHNENTLNDKNKSVKNDKNENTIPMESEKLDVLNSIIEYWNSRELKKTVKNTNVRVGDKLLMHCKGKSKTIESLFKKLFKDYKLEDFKYAIRQYSLEICNREPDIAYAKHRWSLADFLKQQNGFIKYLEWTDK